MQYNNIPRYTQKMAATITPFHLEGMTDRMLEIKLQWVEGNITWYTKRMADWLNTFETDLRFGMDPSVALTMVDENEQLAQVNVNAWYAIQGEMVIRRFREEGGYLGESFYPQIEDLV